MERNVTNLKDSKKLSEDQREDLYQNILDASVGVHTAVIPVSTINEKGFSFAWHLAMKECLDWLYDNVPEERPIYVDGNKTIRGVPRAHYALLPKADNLIPGVMAASVIAKVDHDRIMRDLDADYPEYDWAKNKGYFTSKHMEGLRRYGMCEHHRYTAAKFTTD